MTRTRAECREVTVAVAAALEAAESAVGRQAESLTREWYHGAQDVGSPTYKPNSVREIAPAEWPFLWALASGFNIVTGLADTLIRGL